MDVDFWELVGIVKLQSSRKESIHYSIHHVAALIVKHYLPGRLFTEDAVRIAGLWIVGGRKKVNSIIHQCVTCGRLRALLNVTKITSLPADRLSTEPLFTNVGQDHGFTANKRKSHPQQKIVIFTCMSMRVVHIEVIESLNTSSFISALRRFLSVRGPVKTIRSDWCL